MNFFYLPVHKNVFYKAFLTISIYLLQILSSSTPVFAQIRGDLNSLSPASRTELVNLMMEYITKEIIEDHCNANASGHSMNIHDDVNFLDFHRAYIEGMEDFLLKKGYSQYVPLPSWNPNTATPSEFRVVDSDCQAATCTGNKVCTLPSNWNPRVVKPTYLTLPVRNGQYNDLCDFPPPPVSGSDPTCISEVIEGETGNVVNSNYHNRVHGNMGGAMGYFTSPSAPIFWSFHAYVDDIWKEYECNCPNRGKQQDLYMKDNPKIVSETRDTGKEPSIDTDPVTLSKDIWVRNQNDGTTNQVNQNPVYSKLNYVYVRIRNRGCKPSLGNEKLALHWSKAETAQTWPSYWNGSTTSPALMGDTIDVVTIPVIPAGGSVILEIQWFPPNSNDYSSNTNPKLFSLLARIVAASDPMTVTEGTNAQTNARNNNNIIMKNVTVDVPPNIAPVVAITEPVNNTQYIAPATVVIKANASDNDGSISKVEFYSGSTLIGTATSFPYQYTWTNVSTGSYTLTAKAFDNLSATTVSNAVTIQVKTNNPPTVTITSPIEGATFIEPASIAITASATDTDGDISKVEFYNGATLLGTVTNEPYTYTWQNVTTGTYTITAKAYDNLNATKTSTAITINVVKNSLPTVQITEPANGTQLIAPASTVVKVIAADTDGSISKVELYNDDVLLETLANAPYNFSLSNLQKGTYKLKAKAYDDLNGSSVSAFVTLIVNDNQAPVVTIEQPVNNTSFNAPATIEVKVKATDSDGNILKVELYNGSNLLTTLTTAPYTYTWNGVAEGNYTLTAKAYDNLNAESTSDAITVSVNDNTITSVQITSPSNGAVFTAPANINIKATVTDSSQRIQKVSFYNGATLIGTATTLPYELTWNNVTKGNYSLTAIVYDTLNTAIDTSNIVSIAVNENVLPVVQITSPADSTIALAPATFAIKANANDSDGAISKVEFYSGSTLIGTATSFPYQYTWTNVSTGSYTITAKAYDDMGATTVSSEIRLIVKNNEAPVVTIQSPIDGTTTTAPASFTIKVNAYDNDGSITKVEFYEGNTLLSTATTSPYTHDVSSLAAGVYTYKAKAYDNLNASSTSMEVKVTVNINTPPTVAIASPVNGASFIAPASITIKANASDADGSIKKVEFYNGATLLATITSSPYQYEWNAVSTGNYTLTAKAYDNTDNSAVSEQVTITVKQNKAPIVNIVAPATNTTLLSPAQTTIEANASDADGSIKKVEFYEGSTLLGEALTAPYTFNWNKTQTGSYTISAKAYDNLNAVTTSDNIIIHVVDNIIPVVKIIKPTTGTSYITGSPVPIEAEATDANGSISKVEFYSGTTLLGTATTSPYTYNWTNATIGDYKIIAKAYDNMNAIGISDTVKIHIHENEKPMVMITNPFNGSIFKVGEKLLIGTHYHDDDGEVVKIEFYNNATLIGTETVAPFEFEWKNAPIGKHTITAKATDNLGAFSVSAAISIEVIDRIPAIIHLTSPASGDVFASNSSVEIETQTSNSTDSQIRWVEFYANGTLIAKDSTEPYSYTWVNPAAGTYIIQAKAYDNLNSIIDSEKASITVKNASIPTVIITSPADGAKFTVGTNIPLAAEAKDSLGIQRVEFYQDNKLIATDSIAPYSYVITGAPSGVYALTAKAYNTKGIESTSTTVTIQVENNKLPTITLLSPINNTVYTSSSDLDIIAQANDEDGQIQLVEFYVENKLIGTDSTAPYTYTWKNIPTGTYSISAKAYDNLQASSTSAISKIKVEANKLPIVTITSPTTGSVFFAPASVIIEADASDPNGTITKVDFYRGNVLLGSDSTSPYSYTWKNVSKGSYLITARAYDNLNAMTISSEVRINVNDIPTIIEHNASDITDVIVYPVPFDEQFTVKLILNKSQQANVKLFNETGKMVYQSNNTYQSGEHLINVDAQLLSNGIYYLIIQTNEQFIRKKIVKINAY